MMAASNDTTTGPGAAPIHDQRSAPRGVVPRQLQMWLMIGLAVIILGIILFTGRAAPLPRASAAARTAEPSLMAPDRIQTYQRQLAEDEARLRRELARAPTPAGGGAPTMVNGRGEAPPTDPIVEEQRRREYQSLFADNVALSRRPADAPSYAERATPARAPNPPTSSAMMSPQELVLLQALISQRGASPAPGVPLPAGAAAPEGATPDARASASEAPTSPKETGPIRSTDALQRLSEGTVIETVLINRLNGSFAGPVECLVTTPVYSHDRQRVVIPAGARVLGAAAPVQTWGDSRLAVSFHRLLMPDGRGYSLDRFKGLDQIGETGLKDEVNRHYLQVFGASVAIGALSGLAQYGTTGGFGPSTFGDQYRQAAGASLAASTGRVLDRYLNVLPTITIREGYRIKVYLTNDLDLPAFAPAGPGGAQ
jgi:type IV secretory pathway VirB10-like protein